MTKKAVRIADVILNGLIVLSTVLAVGTYFFSGPDALGSTGLHSLRYFTTDSNILAAAASAVMLVYGIRSLTGQEKETPRWALLFKFVGTVSVALTLLTVVFFLGPTAAMRGGVRAYLRFFAGNTFALHFSTPVLAILSLVCLERTPAMRRRDALWGLLPTAVYAVVYGVMVIFLKLWFDWYGFTFGGKLYLAPFSVLGMLLATLGISLLLYRLRGGTHKSAGSGKADRRETGNRAKEKAK